MLACRRRNLQQLQLGQDRTSEPVGSEGGSLLVIAVRRNPQVVDAAGAWRVL
jgi:hypothetical protein